MIKWSDLAACLGTGDEMPFCLETIPQLRRWCVGEFGIDTNAVRKWEKTGRIPPYARQKLVMRWPERFHDIEFTPSDKCRHCAECHKSLDGCPLFE